MAKGHFDFANFYTAGVLVDRGLSSELYDSAAQWRVQQDLSSEVKERGGPMRYLRPPFEALLFSVFAIWPYPRALLVWTCFKLAILAAIPFVVVRDRPWTEAFPLWATGLLALGTFPVSVDLHLGQDAVLVALLYAIVFWQLDTGRDLGAGVTLALALVKFQFALPFVVILWIAGRKRVLASFAAVAAVLVAISAALVGWRELFHYPEYVLALNRRTGVGIFPDLQMTFRGLLTLIVGRSPYPGPIHWVLVPVAIASVIYAGWLWRKAGPSFLPEGFGLAAIVAIVTSYYAYSYDLILLIVPLLAMLTRSAEAPKADKVTRYLETTGLLLLLLAPIYWFAKIVLHGECLMAIPLIAVGIALARRLNHASSTAVGRAPMPEVAG